MTLNGSVWSMSSDSEWEKEAKCLGSDSDRFFPERNKQLYRFTAAQAKAVCFGKDGRPECPVRAECLADAIDRDERFGIWGGLSHRERNALVRKRDREEAAG